MRGPVSAYRGDEPYIFVSYSHADERLVFDELAWLNDSGFHTWFDEGISGGVRWTEYIAERIRRASLVLYFVTPNSAASEHCANEIDYAVSAGRAIVTVQLKSTELPEGQKLALGGRQMILRHAMSRQAYREKVLEAISGQFGRDVAIPPAAPKRSVFARPATFAGLGLTVVAAMGLWFALSGPPTEHVARASPQEPLPILIADFENDTGVALFNGTLEEALKIGIEAAPFITSYDRNQAQRTLASLGADEQLDEEGARLVAVREGVKLVLAGRIASDGDGYELEMRGVEPVSGETRVTAEAHADDRVQVLEAVALLARQVRNGLGDVTVEQSALDETFTATSLEAASHYAKAQALAADWKHEEAVVEYERATAIDDQLGRAYGGWAYSAMQLGQTERSLELWQRMMTLLDTMTERERLSSLGVYYATAVENHEKAKEIFTELIDKYPADARVANNLALMHFYDRDFGRAIQTQLELLKIYPNRALYRGNLALFYMYAGDFEAATREAEAVLVLHPDYFMAHVPRAVGSFVSMRYQRAAAAYDDMAAIGGAAAYLADIGRADLAMARGDNRHATEILHGLIAEGAESRSVTRARFWLARVQLRSGDEDGAMKTLGAIDEATLRNEELLQLGELRLDLGRLDAAESVATQLRANLRDVPRAYGNLLAAQVAWRGGDDAGAIDLLNAGLERSDMWLAHYLRGRVYLDAGLYPEAMDELALCLERSGEGAAVFLDDVPTYHRLVEVRYWYGRALEEVGQVEPAARAYQDFIAARDLAATDALVSDARARLSALLES